MIGCRKATARRGSYTLEQTRFVPPRAAVVLFAPRALGTGVVSWGGSMKPSQHAVVLPCAERIRGPPQNTVRVQWTLACRTESGDLRLGGSVAFLGARCREAATMRHDTVR